MLKEFYVVTSAGLQSRSIYWVRMRGEGRSPMVVKIALEGKSRVQARKALHHGSMLGIGQFIAKYEPLVLESTGPNGQWWLDRSSPIVGLFLDHDAASKCFETDGQLNPADRRWENETCEVLAAIGIDHPKFRVLRDERGRPLLFEQRVER